MKDSTASMESALKKIKRDPHVFKKKGNENQFRHQESVSSKMEDAADVLNKDSISVAKEKIKEGTDLVTKRMKIIKVTDRTEFGWGTVNSLAKPSIIRRSKTD